jgi:hypothetical protein
MSDVSERSLPYVFPVGPRGNLRLCQTEVQMKIFNDEQCDFLLDGVDENAWRDEVIRDTNEGGDLYRKVQSVLCPIDAGKHFPLLSIANMISEINIRYWQFDITGIQLVEDHPKIFKYSEERGDFYKWHQDIGPASSQRKLGFSIQLSQSDDYEGGDLQLFGKTLHEDNDAIKRRERGTMVVFPSYEYHCVAPVIKGTRYALVGWVEGPAFR